MGNVIVAVLCNLVAALILFSGIFSATRSGWKVTLVKFILSLGGGVGAYFLAPFISDKVYAVEQVPTLLGELHISKGTANSCLFLVTFLAFYALTLIICNIVSHKLIKKMQDKAVNQAKIRRARSINPRAEKMAKKAMWIAMKAEYQVKKNRWWKRIISGFIGGVLALLVGIVVLIPYKYIAADVNHNGDKNYLEDGYAYTINGLIDDKIEFELFDWMIHNEGESEEPAPEVPEEVVPEEVPEDTPGEEVAPEETPEGEVQE